MKPLIIVGALISAASLLGIHWWRGEPRPAKEAASIDQAPSETEQVLLAQVESLTADVRQLKEHQHHAVTAPAPAALPSVDASRAAALAAKSEQPVAGPEEQERLSEGRALRQFDELAHGLAHEPLDSNWSKTAEAALVSSYQGPDFAGAKLQATCKTTFCQVTFDLGGTESPLLTSRLMSSQAPWHTPSILRFDTVTNRGEFYVARENHDLPQPD